MHLSTFHIECEGDYRNSSSGLVLPTMGLGFRHPSKGLRASTKHKKGLVDEIR